MFGKFKNQLYHNIIAESILLTIGLSLFIIGIFYNFPVSTLTEAQQIIFYIVLVLFSGAMAFMFINISIFIRINKINKQENSSTPNLKDSDPHTGLLYPEVFYKKVKDYLLVSTSPACLVIFHAECIEKISRMQETSYSKERMDNFFSILLPERQQTFFSAIKSRHEFVVFIYNYDKEETLDLIDSLQKKMKEELLKLLPDYNGAMVECGYTWYPEHGKTLETLMTNADYALFEAICFDKEEKNEFTPSSYQKQQIEFKRIDKFEQLLSTNGFLYYFQPIVSAKTGEIFAYEALMRTNESINLTPLEILEIAERQVRLYEIEYFTFFNVLEIFKEKYSSFKGRYLFINCLPNQLLTKEDFDTLYKKYNSITHKVVVEASEIYVHTEEEHLLLMERIHTLNAQLALDDYGSGYANELNLVKYSPKYIKIDRCLIAGIDSDDKKQHLVSNIIQFAKQHGMISLAEGVETYKELQTVIYLGVDLLQGYYLKHPAPEITSELAKEQKDEIVAINLKYLKDSANKDTFIADTNGILDLESLFKENYSHLLINTAKLKLIGEASTKYKFTITIPDNSKLELELENVNMDSTDIPCITIGRNCQIQLSLSEDNFLIGQGIKVPESSSLSIAGSGNLTIITNKDNSIGIGEAPDQTYGNIAINISGKLAIHSKCETAICIGGGKGSQQSKIELLSGQYVLTSNSRISIGVGCLEGQANIEIGKISMNLISNGEKSIGIGSVNGSINLSSKGDLSMKTSGPDSCCIGVLSNQKGNIMLQDGTIKLKLNAQHGTAIGSLAGSVYIKLSLKECICLIQGIHMCGIGNHAGTGITEILKGAISIKMAAAHKMYLGSLNGPLLINGGNINCPINKHIKPINKYRIPLRHYRFTDCNTFKEHVEIDSLSYDYEAYTTDYVKDINVYLPEFREYEPFLAE